MTKTLLLMLIMLQTAPSVQYKPVDQGSEIKFTVTNFGFDVSGSFTGLQGLIHVDRADPANDNFDVTIDANTVNTDNHTRDSHLRDEGYFDVKNYPRIHLLSTRIAATSKSGVYQFTGQLTIKGKTMPLSFPFTITPAENDGLLFTGTFAMNRKDFGVGGTSTIANELHVTLRVVTTKQ